MVVDVNYVNVIIWILAFTLMITIYKIFVTGIHGSSVPSSLNESLVNVPMEIKCAFNEDACEQGNIDGWSIVYLIAYSIIGYNIPNQYLVVLFASIIVEVVFYSIGYPARFIMNPLIAISGFSVGSYLYRLR